VHVCESASAKSASFSLTVLWSFKGFIFNMPSGSACQRVSYQEEVEGGRQYGLWGLKQLDSAGFHIPSILPAWEFTPLECALKLRSACEMVTFAAASDQWSIRPGVCLQQWQEAVLPTETW